MSSPPLWRPLDSPSPKASPPPAPVASAPLFHPSVSRGQSSPLSFLPGAMAAMQAAASQHHKTKEPIDLASAQRSSLGTLSSPTPAPTNANNGPSVVSTTAPSAAPFSPFSFPYSPFGNALPFLPPTFNIPGISSLPLQKQALLSPLLASSHFLAAARKAYPFLTPNTSPNETPASVTDVLAEHKALIERFRASAAAMAAAAAFNNNKDEDEDESKSQTSGGVSPPLHSSAENNPIVTTKEHQNGNGASAMDLTKRSSGSEADSVSSVGSEEIIPHLSDTDEETESTNQTQDNSNSHNGKTKSGSEMPLDLTCV
jgi:hypothetical protein